VRNWGGHVVLDSARGSLDGFLFLAKATSEESCKQRPTRGKPQVEGETSGPYPAKSSGLI